MGKPRLTTGDHKHIAHVATGIANKLIAGEGIRTAKLIASLVNEKVISSYKSLKREHPKEYS